MHAVREALEYAAVVSQMPGDISRGHARLALRQSVRSLKPADRARLWDVIAELIEALGEQIEERSDHVQ